MPKISNLLLQIVITAIVIHSSVFAADDGVYEIKKLTVKDSVASTVIDSANRMQVSSLSGTATLKTDDGKIMLNYSAKMSGIFLANPNLMQYSEVAGNHIFQQSDSCINDNETLIKCKVPIEKNRTLQLSLEKLSDKR